MKTVVFANQKGGVLKTTTTATLADALTRKGYKILLVDTDFQCNLTLSVGVNPDEVKSSCEDLLTGTPVKNIIIKTKIGDLIPGSIGFSMADIKFSNDPAAFMALKNSLETVADKYDFCFIDCPPSFGFIFNMNLYAADYVLVPGGATHFSLYGFKILAERIQYIQNKLNPNLKIAGILMTLVNKRARVYKTSLETYTKMAEYLNSRVFNASIPVTVKMERTVGENSIFDLDPTSSVAKAYMELADEFIETVK